MERTPSKTSSKYSKDRIETPEKEEIPPDSDLKHQYKKENSPSHLKQIQEQNEINQQEIQIEENINQYNSNEYQVGQEGQEYEVYKEEPNELNENQNQNQYQTIQAEQTYKVIQQNENSNQDNNYAEDYQSIRYGQPYEIVNKDEEQQENNVYQGNKLIETPSQTYKYQEIQKSYVIPVAPIINKPIIINEGEQLNLMGSENYQINNQINQLNKIYQSRKIEDIENSIKKNAYNTINMSQFRKGIHQVNKKPIIRKNSKPKDSYSKSGFKSRNVRSYFTNNRINNKGYTRIKDIPRLVSFQDISTNKINYDSNMNLTTENLSRFVEIPRDQYEANANVQTLFLDNGMDTGKYRFRGQDEIITETYAPGVVQISEEEVLNEIARRKSEKKKKK